MADAARPGVVDAAQGRTINTKDMFIPFGVILVVMMFIIPLPTFILDALMAMNLILALLVLLIVLYNKKPTDFALFPVVLLVVTVFSLALNVSSTRLILTQGSHFEGRMIKAFSSFVVGSGDTKGLVVGFVIFIILIAVQAVVITKGATRISEVAARFTLDSLPGKQMAIDAEYNSGHIDQNEALKRKEDLQRESDFYGSMDGASKFISGNVKVGILITAVNILGGIIIGSTLNNEDFSVTAGTYISFSIGDGLISQFPALLISTAMGIVVARAAATGELTEQVSLQFSQNAKIYWIAAFVLLGLAFIPEFPKYVLIPMAVLLGYYAYRIGSMKKKKADFDQMMAKSADSARKSSVAGAEISHIDPPDPLSLELGFGLIPLVDKDKGAELMERVQAVRRQTALDLGIVIPKIRIVDNMLLNSSEYCFKIRGVDVGKGSLRLGFYLCINPGTVKEELAGEKTIDPAFGLPALWINEEMRDEAERSGYTVVDPPSIIATHLTEIIKRHASEILGRQETQAIVDGIRKDFPAVVDEVLMGRDGKGLPLGQIQKVLQGLLKEQVSIRNMVSIMEAIADFAPLSASTRFLTEKSRQALGSQICLQYADEERKLHVLTIDPGLEQKIIDSRAQNSSGEEFSALEPGLHKLWIAALSRSVSAVRKQGYLPLILCSESARYLVKTALDRELPEVAVLSVPEIAQDFSLESIGIIRLEQE
ncbi:MAG: flagellar biosynthesis protein FlhA [Treponema sp.]|jgi:flagellar biosynthesis protein FlhA|nr:flagellar biosynthesis protein FlhA [Treponema sp.]